MIRAALLLSLVVGAAGCSCEPGSPPVRTVFASDGGVALDGFGFRPDCAPLEVDTLVVGPGPGCATLEVTGRGDATCLSIRCTPVRVTRLGELPVSVRLSTRCGEQLEPGASCDSFATQWALHSSADCNSCSATFASRAVDHYDIEFWTGEVDGSIELLLQSEGRSFVVEACAVELSPAMREYDEACRASCDLWRTCFGTERIEPREDCHQRCTAWALNPASEECLQVAAAHWRCQTALECDELMAPGDPCPELTRLEELECRR